MTRARLLLLLAAFCVSAATAAPAPGRRGATPGPVLPVAAPAADPVRGEFEAATAPGLGDSTRARLGRFLASHPRHPLVAQAHFELGTLAYASGDYGEAREQFRRARAGELADEARYWEGLAGFALGRTHEARDAVLAVAHARRDVPRRWDSAYLVALSWAQEGRRAEALAAYRALFELPAGPMQAAALYQAQRLAVELSRTDDAQDWGRRLLASYPKSPEAASFRVDAPAPGTAPAAGTPPPGGKSGKPAPGR